MSQIRYHDYLRPLESFAENLRLLGMVNAGRLRGWDSVSFSGTQATLSHSSTGVLKTALTPTSQDGPMGLVVSHQGIMVFEDADVENITVDYNAANAFERIDLLIMSHEHVELGGGTPATYSIIKGGDGGTGVPSIGDPNKQVEIGRFYIQPSAANHDNTIFRPSAPQSLGGYLPYYKGNNNRSILPPENENDSRDFNKVVTPGIYVVTNFNTNRPNTSTQVWELMVTLAEMGEDTLFQTATSKTDGKKYSRVSTDLGVSWAGWQNHNIVDTPGADISDLEAAVGSTDLAGLNYSSNNYVTDGTSLETAIGDLDTQVSTNATNISGNTTNISNNATAIGNRSYLEENYVSDGESITASIDALDIQVKNNEDNITTNTTNIATNVSDIASNLAALDGKVDSGANTASYTGRAIKTVEITNWNMNTTQSKAVAHGLTVGDIRGVKVTLIGDSGTIIRFEDEDGSGNPLGNFAIAADSTNINLERSTSSFTISNSEFDGTGLRGWVDISYET